MPGLTPKGVAVMLCAMVLLAFPALAILFACSVPGSAHVSADAAAGPPAAEPLAEVSTADVSTADWAAQATDDAKPRGYAGRAIGPAVGEGGLLEGQDGIVTFEDLEDLLIWREGKSPSGQAALRQLIELRVVEHLGKKQGVVISEEELGEKMATLDDEARRSGLRGGLTELMSNEGVKPEEFRRYLRLAMIHEALTRQALGLKKSSPITPDQQQLWLENTLKERGYKALEHPWSNGIVAESGDISITRQEFAQHLRDEIVDEEQREACFVILLERAVRKLMPEVSDVGAEAALDREIERRQRKAAADPKFQGASYDQVLNARGLSLDSLRRDPAIRAAALAHDFVDRKHNAASIRQLYETERARFDSRFGEAVEVRILYKNASQRSDDPLRDSFSKVEKELESMRDAMEGPDDFLGAVEIHSQDRETRKRKGLLGTLTRHGNSGEWANLREASFKVVDEDPDNCKGKILGPVRLTNGVVLVMLGGRTPAPTWPEMAKRVHQDQRRQFMERALTRDQVATYLDAK